MYFRNTEYTFITFLSYIKACHSSANISLLQHTITQYKFGLSKSRIFYYSHMLSKNIVMVTKHGNLRNSNFSYTILYLTANGTVHCITRKVKVPGSSCHVYDLVCVLFLAAAKFLHKLYQLHYTYQ